MLSANPVVHAVQAATDTQNPWVETVLTDLGKLKKVGEEGHVVVSGVNGSNDGYQAVLKGTADGIVAMDLDATGQTAVDLATRLMNGESMDRVNALAFQSQYTCTKKRRILVLLSRGSQIGMPDSETCTPDGGIEVSSWRYDLSLPVFVPRN